VQFRAWQSWLPCLILAGSLGRAAGAGAQNPPVPPLAGPGAGRQGAPTLVAFADSFVSSHGSDSGWICDHFTPTATGYQFTESFFYGPHQSRTTVVSLSPGMVVDEVRARGESRSLVLDLDVVYTGQRAVGWYYRTDPDSLTKVPFETDMPDSAFDAAAQMALFPTFDWRVGMQRHLLEFEPIHARTSSAVLAVVAEEDITVPAGTFATYRAELRQARTTVYLWFTRAVPHRPVKVFDPARQWTTVMVRQIE
jgi:hypothetical protein